MKNQPPYRALQFLRWFCKEEYLEEIEGDLTELYEKRKIKSRVKAAVLFHLDVIRSIRIKFLKPFQIFQLKKGLWYNALKMSFRLLKRDISFSLINIIGLSIGIAIFFTLILVINHEYSFDKFHKKGERIFEVIQVFQNGEGEDPEIFTSLKLSEALRNEMPMVENSVTIHGASSSWMEANGKRIFEEDGIVAGPQFFEIFDFPLNKGLPKEALKRPRSIVIDTEMSRKYFGYQNPIGKTITLERYGSVTITAIMEKLPSNSFIQFNYIITQDYDVFFNQVAPWFPDYFNSWEGDPAATFVLLHDPVDADKFSEEASNLLLKYKGKKNLNPYFLINLYDLHFGLSGIDGRVNEYLKGNRTQINLFTIVAFSILLIACFNYVNLTIARSIKRHKEVKIRKTFGASSGQVKIQFLVEALFMTLIASSLSILWVIILLPRLGSVLHINISHHSLININIFFYLITSILVISFFSGLYPSLRLSKIRSIIGNNSSFQDPKNYWVKKSMLTVQFIVVIVLLMSLVTVNRQFNYLSNKSLGFNTEKLLVIEVNGGGVRRNFNIIKNKLLENPGISHVTGLTRMISGYRTGVMIKAEDYRSHEISHTMSFYGLDNDGLKTLGLKLRSGHDYTGNHTLDSSSIIINQRAAEIFGGEDILGRNVILRKGENSDEILEATVIGIVDNFHYRSLHDPIGPVVLGYYKNPFQGLEDIVIRLKGDHISESLSYIENVHNSYDENGVITWEFLEDMKMREYQSELKFRNGISMASIIALILALSGLVGLVAYTASTRTKEFGVRKVLGARFTDIIILQGKVFFKYLFVAAIISLPLAWLFLEEWLNRFAYRVEQSIIYVVLILVIISALTIISVLLVGAKTALQNPAKALRNE